MSTGPKPPVFATVSERLAELAAGRLGALPLEPVELAVLADLIALATALLAKEAATTSRALPIEALVGAQRLREWAQATAREQPSRPGQRPAGPRGGLA